MTLAGVKELLEEQDRMMTKLGSTHNADSTENMHDKHREIFKAGAGKEMNKSQTNLSFTTMCSSQAGITKSSSSSMQTLRRILEIEEMRQFSEMLELKLQ